jgi:subtilisin family serine protease
LLLCLGTAQGGPPVGKGRPYVEGEILVKYKARVTAAAQEAQNEGHGARKLKTFRRLGVHLLGLPKGMAVQEALGLFEENPDVQYAEPNYIVRVAQSQIIPNDQNFSKQWYLHNVGQALTVPGEGTFTGVRGADISAPEAWNIGTGDGSIVVAVVDTGVDYTHPDLAANIWHNSGETDCTDGLDDDGNGYIDDCEGWDFANNDNDPTDDFADTHGDVGHGTRVAGIIGAEGNNFIGVCGINWNIRMMPLKFMDSAGSGTVALEVEAIDYAVRMGAKIINASYGLSAASDTERLAIQAARDAGVLFVAAAGNNSLNNDEAPFYPASYALDNIVSVAASDYNDGLAHFSNYGPASVDLAAPGVYIYSTTPGPGYGFLSGTSFSTPMVSGAAALLMAGDPSLGYSLTRQLILSTVDVKASMSAKLAAGGRLNLFNALSADPNGFAPIRPSALTASAISVSEISLAWVDNSTNETGFDLQRKTGGGLFEPIAAPGVDETSYTDTGLSEGTDYTYRVRAVGETGDSPYSNDAVMPAAPGNLVANAASSSGINLLWTDNSSVESGYIIERKAASGGAFGEIATAPANATSYSDAGVAIGTTYTYRVRAFASGGVSLYSNEANATALPISASDGGGGGGGCFVATAAYGSYLAPEVKVLRDFRDRHLLTNAPGRLLVSYYYRFSPPWAGYISRHAALRAAARAALTPLVYGVKYPVGALLLTLCAVAALVYYRVNRKRRRLLQ